MINSVKTLALIGDQRFYSGYEVVLTDFCVTVIMKIQTMSIVCLYVVFFVRNIFCCFLFLLYHVMYFLLGDFRCNNVLGRSIKRLQLTD